MKRWAVRAAAMLAIGLGLLCGYAGWYLLRQVGGPPEGHTFSIAEGTTLRGVARQLAQAGMLPEPWTFALAGRITGAHKTIKAGNFHIRPDASTWNLLELFTRGRQVLEELRFVEGTTFRELRAALDAHPSLRHDTQGMSEASILAALGATEPHPEGLFYPDTYYFSPGSSDLAVLRRAYQGLRKRLDALWESRDPELPFSSPYEALILASIVEKETGRASERATIAGVFVNRLRKGMKLQTDPTVIYGMGSSFDGNLRRRDLQTDTPYNTYTRAGLPPTPIAMPGAASLAASLRPQATGALYFVARGDGTSHFSRSLAEHNEAVARYQRSRQ